MISEEVLIASGYQSSGIYFQKGGKTIMECLGKWYQVHINPINLSTEQVEITSLSDLQGGREYDTPRPPQSQGAKKKQSIKPLLPQHIVKKSDKWYFDTQTKKWIISDKIKAQYTVY